MVSAAAGSLSPPRVFLRVLGAIVRRYLLLKHCVLLKRQETTFKTNSLFTPAVGCLHPNDESIFKVFWADLFVRPGLLTIHLHYLFPSEMSNRTKTEQALDTIEGLFLVSSLSLVYCKATPTSPLLLMRKVLTSAKHDAISAHEKYISTTIKAMQPALPTGRQTAGRSTVLPSILRQETCLKFIKVTIQNRLPHTFNQIDNEVEIVH